MSEQTPVERAAGLYEQALHNRRGVRCSEEQFSAATNQAVEDVTKLLSLEGVKNAEELACAGKLMAEAKRHGRLR